LVNKINIKSKKEMRYELTKSALACVPARYKNFSGEWNTRTTKNIANEAIMSADTALSKLYPDEP
jgi:hypothetical protein